jgi:16S rRNA (uracil1498-N3)-methyltransferase
VEVIYIKYFINKDNITENKIDITGGDSNHIKKVLRLGKGDSITLCDGEGTDYNAVIEEITRYNVRVIISSSIENKIEPPVLVTLFQSVPKSDKMDWIIQKSVELGVSKVIPIITERTVVRPEKGRIEKDKKEANKIKRWNRIAMESAKQCGRGKIPVVYDFLTFEEAMKKASVSDILIIPYELEEEINIKEFLKNNEFTDSKKYRDIALIVGPEGGFTREEIYMAVKTGFRPVSLGPRIMRVETAAIAVLTIIMYEMGDIGGRFKE